MIQKLEDELGVKIFDRKRQPIRPTPAGMTVIEEAWKVLNRAKKLKQTVEEEQQSLTGTFNVGVLPTIAPYLIPRFFPQLMNEHPEMDIRITEMKTEGMLKALRSGGIDAGILAQVEGLEELNITPLYREQFMGYVAENDPLYKKEYIKPADLSGEFLWLLDEGHCFRDQLVKFCQLKSAARSKRSYNLGSIETFMRIVEHGKGVTFIPQLAVSQLSTEQHALVRPFAHPVPTRDIVFATSKNFIRHTLLNKLAACIKDSLPEDVQKIEE
jgi:redox-sensitive transcriptional activator oxyR